MGASRESFNLLHRPRQALQLRNWKYNKRLMFEDTFMWIACRVFGHVPYVCDTHNGIDEWACKRCHRYI